MNNYKNEIEAVDRVIAKLKKEIGHREKHKAYLSKLDKEASK